MKARPVILSTLFSAMVGGAGVQVWRMVNPVSGGVTESAPAVAAKSKPSLAALPQPMGARRFAKAAAGPQKEEITSTRDLGGTSTNLSSVNSPLISGIQTISEQELRRRASAVEQEANHDLKYLMGLLDLTETQQDRIFDSLVRHAPGWHPAMQAVGVAVPVDSAAKIPDASSTTAATSTESAAANQNNVLDAIAADLTPDQLLELANAELDRQEWWEEIIPKLLPDSETPSITGGVGAGTGTTAAAAPPPAEDKAGEEPAVLAE